MRLYTPLPQNSVPTGDLFSVSMPHISRTTQLTEIIGIPAATILDAACGNGSWLRAAQKAPWAAHQVTLFGYELAEPVRYPGTMPDVQPEIDWDGLTILHRKNDEHYPAPRSVDLVHESFIEVQHERPSQSRFSEYKRLLRRQGCLLFAHNQDLLGNAGINYTHFTGWLEHENFNYVMWMKSEVPADYPKSDWWHYMNQHGGGNFLIAAWR